MGRARLGCDSGQAADVEDQPSIRRHERDVDVVLQLLDRLPLEQDRIQALAQEPIRLRLAARLGDAGVRLALGPDDCLLGLDPLLGEDLLLALNFLLGDLALLDRRVVLGAVAEVLEVDAVDHEPYGSSSTGTGPPRSIGSRPAFSTWVVP